MKKFLVLLFLLPILGLSQEAAFLKTIGRPVHLDQAPIYKGTVVLSASFSSYPSEAIRQDQMKIKYDEALKKNGLSISDLAEKPDLYSLMGYEKKESLYMFETTDIQQFQQFLSASCFGLKRLNYDTSFILNAEETLKLVTEAMENAHINAALTATGIGKKLGKVLWIEDNN